MSPDRSNSNAVTAGLDLGKIDRTAASRKNGTGTVLK